MDFDFELEEILDSAKKDKDKNEDTPLSGEKEKAKEPLEPPKKNIKNDEASPDLSVLDRDKSEKDEPSKKSEDKASKKSRNDKIEKLKGLKKNLKLSFKLPKFVETLTKKPENQKEKAQKKKIIIILCSIIAAIVVIICAVSLIHYETGGYVEHYSKKYNVTYPAGIRKEFCNDYGKDQSFCGTLTIEDTKTDEVKVYSTMKKNSALLDKGSDIKQDQHIRAVSLDKKLADIESVYKSSNGFLKASQKLTFDTLFDEEEYKVVAAYYTNTDPNDDNGYVFPYNTYGNLTAWSFFQYQDRITTKSLYKTGYKLKRSDYVLSVSVPTDFMPNFRFVIVCVKNEGRKFDKITSTTANDNIYYPQVWYDKNQKKNPYYLARGWYPEIKVGSNGATKKLGLKDFQ